MMISIAICTCNNARKLTVALESLRALTCPEGLSYEILVIDNNSRDETKEVVARYQPVWGSRLRYIFEGTPGLSHARNRALREARGEIVSYLDDDVKVDPGWLAAVAATFEQYSPAVVGGRSYLIYPSRRPSWFPEHYEFLLSRLDYGDQVMVDTDQDLYGLNLSVRKDLALEVGGFNPKLGREARSLRSGEEVDFLRRVRARGGVAVYQPAAVVGHIVPPERLRMRWFLKRACAPGMIDETTRVGPSTMHLLRCCGSIGRSLVCGEWRRDVLFGKCLSILAAGRRLYESLRQLGRGGNPKFEIQNSKQFPNSKSE